MVARRGTWGAKRPDGLLQRCTSEAPALTCGSPPGGLALDVTTPPAGWSPWPAARAHWGRWGGLLEASLRTTSLNATCAGQCVAATFQLTAAQQSTAWLYRHARTTLGATRFSATWRVSLLLRGYRFAFARVLTTERATSSATMAMTCPTRMARFRSNAGRHSASPSLITHAPAGLARTPKPAPPFPSVSPPPPPPPMTLASGMIVSPSSWYGSP